MSIGHRNKLKVERKKLKEKKTKENYFFGLAFLTLIFKTCLPL
jgi:hypothetical protein